MMQLGLQLDPPRARRRDPDTSREAAERVNEFAAAHYQKIIAALRLGPGSIYDLADRAGITHVQAARRMGELEVGKQVRVVQGEKRRSPSGRPCRVWART